MRVYGIGRGEAACLVLVQRDASTAVFLSSDGNACQTAQALGVSFLTIPDILTQWVCNTHPSLSLFQQLIEGMRNARFTLPESVINKIFIDTPSFPVTRAEVYWYIFDKETATAQDIAVGTRMAKSTAQGHLAALERAGVLRGEGRPKLYRICGSFSPDYMAKLQELESLARSTWRLNGIEPI